MQPSAAEHLELPVTPEGYWLQSPVTSEALQLERSAALLTQLMGKEQITEVTWTSQHRCFKATPPDIQGLMVLPSGPKCQTSTLKLKHETPSASNKDAYRCYFKQGGDVILT